MKAPLRTAVVGLGWAAYHRHLPALIKHPSFSLSGVMDPSEDKLQAVIRKFKPPHATQARTLKQAAWLEDVDVIVIASPPQSHSNLAIDTLIAGKHVLIEKPFTLSLNEAKAIEHTTQSNKRTVCAFHNFLFCKAFLKLKKTISQGKLGRITRISGSYSRNSLCTRPPWARELPLDGLYNELPHFLYLSDYLAQGEMRLLHAQSFPDFSEIIYTDENHTPISLTHHMSSTLSEWHLVIYGSKATALLDLYRDFFILLKNDDVHKSSSVLRTSLSAVSQHLWQYIPNGFSLARGSLDYGTTSVYDRFAQAIISTKDDDQIGLSRALGVSKLQDEAITALQENVCA